MGKRFRRRNATVKSMASLFILLSCFLFGCVVTPQEQLKPQTPTKEGYEFVFGDEFDEDTLNRENWNYQLGVQDDYFGTKGPKYWGNNELEYYTEDAVTVSGGTMKITACKESRGDRSYTSGGIVTRGLRSFTYGYFEARMKLPTVSGMWPAFWLLPQPTDRTSTDNVYGGWATNGEIDIMEARGNDSKSLSGAVHHGGRWPNNLCNSKGTKVKDSIAEWHTYAIEWTADCLKWYCDDENYFTVPKEEWRCGDGAKPTPSAPFDQPFYILFNLAVDGGHFGAGDVPEDFTSAQMEVDYVRVFKRA